LLHSDLPHRDTIRFALTRSSAPKGVTSQTPSPARSLPIHAKLFLCSFAAAVSQAPIQLASSTVSTERAIKSISRS